MKGSPERLQTMVHVWVTKLTLLQEKAGGIGDAPTIDSVINVLQGVSAVSSLDNIVWNDDFVASLKEVCL